MTPYREPAVPEAVLAAYTWIPHAGICHAFVPMPGSSKSLCEDVVLGPFLFSSLPVVWFQDRIEWRVASNSACPNCLKTVPYRVARPSYYIASDGSQFSGPLPATEDPNPTRQLGQIIAEHASKIWIAKGGGELPNNQAWRAWYDGAGPLLTFAVNGAETVAGFCFEARAVQITTEVRVPAR